MKEKQQQLLYDKGITNIPSDALCSDNALAESMGMVYDDGEHRVIQKPKDFITSAVDDQTTPEAMTMPTLLFVHRLSDSINYICLDNRSDSLGQLIWGTKDGTVFNLGGNLDREARTLGGNIQIEAIGKTLIVSDDDEDDGGVHYYLWDATSNTYKDIGNSLPEIKVEFSLGDPTDLKPDDPGKEIEQAAFSIEGMINHTFHWEDESQQYHAGDPFYWSLYVENSNYNDLKNALIGCVSKRINEVHGAKRFAFPFFVRFAYRLYDGSHTRISNPVLMLPSYLHNCDIFFSDSDGNRYPLYNEEWDNGVDINYKPKSSELKYKIYYDSTELSNWEDIIKGIDIFVSEEQKPFDMEGAWGIINPFDTAHMNENTILKDEYIGGYSSEAMVSTAWDPQTPEDKLGFLSYFNPVHLTRDEMANGLIDKSVFYKIAELDTGDFSSASTTPVSLSGKIYGTTLVNLTTQTQLENDDYFSHVSLRANILKSYNMRLHLADYWRGFYEGFEQFTTAGCVDYLNQDKYYDYAVVVYIDSDSGERIAVKKFNSNQILDLWFYYPDPRASRAELYYKDQNNDYHLFGTLKLKEHPGLHGAYYLNTLPPAPIPNPSLVLPTSLPEENLTPEHIDNELIYSEVNNPFTFTASGSTKVGQGAIIGLATQTVALGQEEHGIHPMIVFTKRGMSILRVNDTGIYVRSDELSREVCVNAKSITETDGAVFFASDKGLMVAVGSQVKCVSEQLSGKTNVFKDGNNVSLITDLGNFCDYLKSAFIAYDYRDSLLWIFKGTSRYCYIYAIKSGSFSKYDFGASSIISNVVNDYPDYLLQSGSAIYSLTNRNNINNDVHQETTQVEGHDVTVDVKNTYNANMLTRPMKLENALALKSIMQIKHISQFDASAGMTMRMFASNNLADWIELKSLRGMPWKYYRFRFDFTNLIATDRFAGSVLVTQERRTDKLR